MIKKIRDVFEKWVIFGIQPVKILMMMMMKIMMMYGMHIWRNVVIWPEVINNRIMRTSKWRENRIRKTKKISKEYNWFKIKLFSFIKWKIYNFCKYYGTDLNSDQKISIYCSVINKEKYFNSTLKTKLLAKIIEREFWTYFGTFWDIKTSASWLLLRCNYRLSQMFVKQQQLL